MQQEVHKRKERKGKERDNDDVDDSVRAHIRACERRSSSRWSDMPLTPRLILAYRSVQASEQEFSSKQNDMELKGKRQKPGIVTSLLKRNIPEHLDTEQKAYITAYKARYGSISGLCKELSYYRITEMTQDVNAVLTEDIPSFVRLNQTFPAQQEGAPTASCTWVYTHLLQLFTTLGVEKDKLSKEQVEFISAVITANNPTMKLTEFMLFESRFLSGRYKEFYGETSYMMTITRSLEQFKDDLRIMYRQLEREKTREEHVTPGITWEEFCRRNGKDVQPLAQRINVCEQPYKVTTKRSQTEIETQQGVRFAHAVIDNTLGVSTETTEDMRKSFTLRYGKTPEQYLYEHEEIIYE